MPLLINKYNRNMEEVDRRDQNVSLYPNNIRGKKWYIPLIFYCIDLVIQNAWQLSCTEAVPLKIDMLSFRCCCLSHQEECSPKHAGMQGLVCLLVGLVFHSHCFVYQIWSGLILFDVGDG